MATLVATVVATFVAACVPIAAGAQTPAPASSPAQDAAAFSAAVIAARHALAADRGRLWHARLDTLQWMGFENGQVWLTADPLMPGYTRTGATWTGPLPAGITPSNTPVTWNGKRWAMVLLPLPPDSALTLRLLIHEAMHTVQPTVLPVPKYDETGAGSGLLDEAAGRSWMRLEWRALAAALAASGHTRDDAVRDALVFRAARYAAATDDEITRERALDVSEGIPEYTGWRLSRSPRSAFIASLDSAPRQLASFVRGFPYYTGPAYAFLLDDYEGAAWHPLLRMAPDLQRQLLLAWREHATPDAYNALVYDVLAGTPLTADQRETLTAHANVLAERYGATAIRAEEDTRWATRQRQLAEYRARFVSGPTIRIRPATLNISFNPRGQASLGADGTVMANLAWRGPNGAMLTAPDGALVTPTWTEVRVPRGTVQLAPGVLTAPLSLRGDGWALELPAGWTVAADGESLVLSPGNP